MTIPELEAHIEALTDERRRCYARRQPVNGIAEELDQAWAQLRLARAVRQHGAFDSIVARARVERELEKLINDDDTVAT